MQSGSVWGSAQDPPRTAFLDQLRPSFKLANELLREPVRLFLIQKPIGTDLALEAEKPLSGPDGPERTDIRPLMHRDGVAVGGLGV